MFAEKRLRGVTNDLLSGFSVKNDCGAGRRGGHRQGAANRPRRRDAQHNPGCGIGLRFLPDKRLVRLCILSRSIQQLR